MNKKLLAALGICALMTAATFANGHLGIARGLVVILPGVDGLGNPDEFALGGVGEGISVINRNSGFILQKNRGTVTNVNFGVPFTFFNLPGVTVQSPDAVNIDIPAFTSLTQVGAPTNFLGDATCTQTARN